MKLYLHKTSPFSRIVRVVALEKGLAKQIELCSPLPAESYELLGLGVGLMGTSFSSTIGRRFDTNADNTVLGKRKLIAIKRSLSVISDKIKHHITVQR